MEPIFTLPFPEYKVVQKLTALFKPKDGYSILLPLSRQQKGFDLVIYNLKTHKSASIQVKSSRSHDEHLSKKDPNEHYIWYMFNYEKGLADCYILVGVYPKKTSYKKRLAHSRATANYDHIFILLKDNEMAKFQASFKTKKGKRTSHFEIGFDDNGKKLVLFPNEIPFSKYLLENRVKEIRKILK